MKLVYMIAHHRSFKRVTSEPRPANNSLSGVQDLTHSYLHLHATTKEVNMATKTKEEGMAQALDNANIDWKNEVEKRMTFLLENKRFFTSDDVLVYLTDRNIKTTVRSAVFSTSTQGVAISPRLDSQYQADHRGIKLRFACGKVTYTGKEGHNGFLSICNNFRSGNRIGIFAHSRTKR